MTLDREATIAIIDDDPAMLDAVARLLSARGYVTETFDSAEAFLNAIATCKANCLLVDIQLSDISGVELAHQLKADGVEYPIIFMTGLNDETIRSQAVAAGCIAFLYKPFPEKLLIDAIEKAIG